VDDIFDKWNAFFHFALLISLIVLARIFVIDMYDVS
jgi:hypothetical protein